MCKSIVILADGNYPQAKYPLHVLHNADIEFWWKGTLNEATGDVFSLEFSHPAPVLLFSLY